jgi:hypothetical protein
MVTRTGTAPYGSASFNSTGAFYEWPLSVGQTIRYNASALGYTPNSIDDTLAFTGQVTTLYLQNNQSGVTPPTNGGWSPTVHVKSACDNSDIYGAFVGVTTGLNGACSITDACSGNTDSTGSITWNNISASTLASIHVVSQQYVDQTFAVTVNHNATQTINANMVPKNGMSSCAATPGPTSTVTPGATFTTGPYPTITDENGDPITSPEGKADYALGIFIDALVTIATITVGIILIWLMWMVVYIITGGKIIDKIMRRGRGGRR